jgi:hypothetical protein
VFPLGWCFGGGLLVTWDFWTTTIMVIFVIVIVIVVVGTPFDYGGPYYDKVTNESPRL